MLYIKLYIENVLTPIIRKNIVPYIQFIPYKGAIMKSLIRISMLASLLISNNTQPISKPNKIQAGDPYVLISQEAERFKFEQNIPGIAIAVYYKDTEYFYISGLADVEKNKLVARDTIFEIGSVTKVFTSTLLAQEAVKRPSILDSTLEKYLEYLKTHKCALNKITLKQLATHTSSLPTDAPSGSTNTETEIGLIEAFLQWEPVSKIGAVHSYSNVGYRFLGFALQNHLNKSYLDALKEAIFTPLAMTHTLLDVPSHLDYLYAQGYNGMLQPANRTVTHQPGSSGSLRSNITDMMQFLKASLRLIGPDSLKKAMNIAQTGDFRVSVAMVQGLGWQCFTSQTTQIEMKEKNGATNGFASHIGIVPTHTLGIVVLTNKIGGQKVTTFARSLLNQLISL